MRPTDVRSADAEAFTAAFHACYLDVLNFIARRVGDIHRAEDLTAEVFTRAWQRWPKAPPEARPWLFGIAHHVVADSYRDTDQRRRLDERLTQTPGPLSDAVSVDHSTFADMSIDLRRAWAALSVGDREVLSLVAWDGLTGEQAATVLGCTRAAFSVRLTRARRRLKQLLDAPRPAAVTIAAPAPSPTARPAIAVPEGSQP